MIRRAIQALLEADDALAESVIAMDKEVDAINKSIHNELIQVMEHNADAAEQALNAIIIARNLERAGDHATNIAEDVIFWVRGNDVRHKFSMIQEPTNEDKHLPTM